MLFQPPEFQSVTETSCHTRRLDFNEDEFKEILDVAVVIVLFLYVFILLDLDKSA